MISEKLSLDKNGSVALLLADSCIPVWILSGQSVHTSTLAVQYRWLLFSFSSIKKVLGDSEEFRSFVQTEQKLNLPIATSFSLVDILHSNNSRPTMCLKIL